MATPTLNSIVRRMRAEITDLVLSGHIPVQVSSFGELHDYIDANELGGLCDDSVVEPIIESFGGRVGPDFDLPEGFVDFLNTAQSRVDGWLSVGGLEDAIGEISWEDSAFGPYAYGDLLIKFKTAMRALDEIRCAGIGSSTSVDKLRETADSAWRELRSQT